MAIEIKHLKPGDDVLVAQAGHLFDDLPQNEAIRRFLAEPTHHLLVAYAHDQPVGFVSGVELTHPDKGTEMFLYELAVEPDHQRRGIGTALVNELGKLARSRGCYGMWVLADDDNAAAAATYRQANGAIESKPDMFSWRFVADEEV
jgi:ribosomal protein S18 acetylase RimI-like enzyme